MTIVTLIVIVCIMRSIEGVVSCGRTLHREQMHKQADKLDWLIKPELIPENIVVNPNFIDSKDPYWCLAGWMKKRFGEWAAMTHGQLALREAFEKHGLANEDRVIAREKFLPRFAEEAYEPGLTATAEIHQVIPELATREHIPREAWPSIASSARVFGSIIARDGTHVQALIRRYLWVDPYIPNTGLDASKLKLDATTGITTVTDIEYILEIAKKLIDEYIPTAERKANVCIALQAPSPKGKEHGTFFDATWEAYGYVTDKSIYPNLDAFTVSDEAPPDDDLEASFWRMIKEKADYRAREEQLLKYLREAKLLK